MNHPAEERSNERSPHGNFRRNCDEGRREGHISQNCLNRDLVEFPTEEVEYDPQEIEAMIGMERPGREADWIPGRT